MKRVKVEGDLYHGVVPEGAVYVGRATPGLAGSKFANPHPVGKPCRLCAGVEHSRGAAVIAYRRWLADHPELIEAARTELAGKDVACWCSPTEQCHGDTLIDVANLATSPVDTEGHETPFTHAERFKKFDTENPHVFQAYVRLTAEWDRSTGGRKIGIGALTERVRWELAIRTNDPEFRINNNHRAFYVRKLIREYPGYTDLFELRKSVADEDLGLAS